MDNRFTHEKYHIRKKVLSVAGAKLHIFDTNEQLLFFSKMKAFKLKEDIRLYSNEEMNEEFVTIKARKAVDFSGVYDVFDTATGDKIGALKRKGLKSMLKDEWLILDNYDSEIGTIKEDSMGMALLRRFLTNLIPQSYHVTVKGTTVAVFKQNFNPFVTKLNLDFSSDRSQELDRRLGLAAGILLCAIEGKQG